MTTWTPVTAQSETWTANAPGLHVFSPMVFSHASHTSLRVFALGSADGKREFWDTVTAQSEIWIAA